MRTIDLSRPIYDRMPVHPHDSPVELYKEKLLERDGYTSSRLSIGMHAGTHIDAPVHFLPDTQSVATLSPGRFIGRGVMLDVRGEAVISYKPHYGDTVPESSIVLFYTGFADSHAGAEYYKAFNSHPVLDKSMADFLVYRRVKLVGMDMPKPDNYPFPVHRQLLGQGVLLLENLINLSALLDEPEFIVAALPLRIKAEASPVRAVAICGLSSQHHSPADAKGRL